MPRPRFHKLPPEHQEGILRAALEEFAAHGFNAASLNRIIDAAGISKGSMYYYFDGKEDLYAHVLRVELGRMFEAAGPFPIPTARTPEAFWSAIEESHRRLVGALMSSPRVAALAVRKYFRPATIIPMHYATFPPLATAAEVRAAFKGDRRVRMMTPGETRTF